MMTEHDREPERRVMRARGAARKQGYGVRERRGRFDVLDPWTHSTAAEDLDIAELEAWLAEGVVPRST